MIDTSHSFSHKVDEEVWNVIWKLKAPSKVRNFLWRNCSNNQQGVFIEKKVLISPMCLICGKEEETI